MISTVVSMKSAQTAMADAVAMTHYTMKSEGALTARLAHIDGNGLTVSGTNAEKPRFVRDILVFRAGISSLWG